MQRRACIVGAGFSGAVIARELANGGIPSLVLDKRSHIAGNCHTHRDPETNVMVHAYGPHIFHTAHVHVWEYIRQYCTMKPYVNRVKTTVGGSVYSLPINLHTINQFFGTTLLPDEARSFLASKARKDITDPSSFEEQALSMLGEELYKAFFYGYTRKQWGVEPSSLPASILKRLPVRFNYDDNYFAHPFQGMPEDGYTDIVARILEHPLIEVRLNASYDRSFEQTTSEAFLHTFYSGAIDEYFGYTFGQLGYRTLRFERHRFDTEDRLGAAVMNFGDYDVPFTRCAEHKHFSPWDTTTKGTVCFYEYSAPCGRDDIPFYPIRLVDEKQMLSQYVSLASEAQGVTFVGRLGTYQYLDMDETIHRALETAAQALRQIEDARRNGLAAEALQLPPFVHDPL